MKQEAAARLAPWEAGEAARKAAEAAREAMRPEDNMDRWAAELWAQWRAQEVVAARSAALHALFEARTDALVAAKRAEGTRRAAKAAAAFLAADAAWTALAQAVDAERLAAEWRADAARDAEWAAAWETDARRK